MYGGGGGGGGGMIDVWARGQRVRESIVYVHKGCMTSPFPIMSCQFPCKSVVHVYIYS